MGIISTVFGLTRLGLEILSHLTAELVLIDIVN